MKKDELGSKVNRILDEKETFLLSLMLLAHLHDDKKYNNLSELIFLFDSYSGFKQFVKYYEGQTIEVPTLKELTKTMRLLELFQKVKIDKQDFDESYEQVKLGETGLNKTCCQKELDKFYRYLKDEGPETLKLLRRISKQLK